MELINYWNTWVASFVRARFGRTDRGASLVEYVLLVSLIAVVCIGAISFLGGKASDRFSSVGSSIG
ncbi:MAG: pilus assembly protein Flp/PilA [Actinomycetota bacterium]